MNALSVLETAPELMVVQKKELLELVGFESRNKYSIELNGMPVAYAAEQGKGFFDVLMRHFFGHFRTFEIHFFDTARNLLFRAVHPFRFFFKRLEVRRADGQLLGAVQQRWAFFSKRFDVEGPAGEVVLSVSAPLWKPWTFSFQANGSEAALVEKKWSGMLTEMFTDADRFRVVFPRADMPLAHRTLVLAAALFIDLMYFEKPAS